MQISELLEEKHILLNLEARRLNDLFDQVVTNLYEMGEVKNRENIINHLVEREQISSTGLKGGFAIPHTYPPSLDDTVLCLGVCPGGIDFKLQDHEPVHVFFLLLGAHHRQAEHIRLLASISRTIRTPWLHDALLEADTAGDAMELIKKAENAALDLNSGNQ
jgi:mannitol/fructose-specific phosphotransferase system IIA component (Ntr-type)